MKKLEAFFFKYFSSSTKDNEDSWVRWAFTLLLMWLVLCAVISDQFGWLIASRVFICIFNLIFIPFGILWIIVWFYHKWRIKNKEQ